MQTSTQTSCIISVQTLREAPYSLAWGDSVFAKVLAINFYGESALSESANGAEIVTTPSAPIGLEEVYDHRTKSTLGITWSPASFTGGS